MRYFFNFSDVADHDGLELADDFEARSQGYRGFGDVAREMIQKGQPFIMSLLVVNELGRTILDTRLDVSAESQGREEVVWA